MSSKSHEASLKRYEQIFFRWCLYDLFSSTHTKLLRYAIEAYEKLTTSVLCVLNFIVYFMLYVLSKVEVWAEKKLNSFFRYHSVETA